MCIVGRGGASWLGQINFIFFNFEFELSSDFVLARLATSRHVQLPNASSPVLENCNLAFGVRVCSCSNGDGCW